MATRLILLILIFINMNYVVFADEKNFEILDKKNNYAKISIFLIILSVFFKFFYNWNFF